MIQRAIQIQMRETAKVFPAIALLGPRQVGKTTLAKQFAKSLNIKHLYLDMEKPEDRILMDNAFGFLNQYQDTLIIIDEVQRVQELFPVLRSLIDEKRRPGRFLLLGSASPALLLHSAETLAGRIYFHELYPCTLKEVTPKYALNRLLLRGGFPIPFLENNMTKAQLWHEAFLTSYVERDLPLLGLSVSPLLMRRLLHMLAHLHGSIINYSKLASALGISSPTVQKAIDFLEHAFLVRRLPPWFTNVKKRITKQPKIYFRDSGILLYLLKIQTIKDLYSHPQCGVIWEGFVIEHIISQFRNKYDYTFYRTQAGTEVDLVLIAEGKPQIAIETKFTATPQLTKGNKLAIVDLKTKKNYIIAPRTDQKFIHFTEQYQLGSLELILNSN